MSKKPRRCSPRAPRRRRGARTLRLPRPLRRGEPDSLEFRWLDRDAPRRDPRSCWLRSTIFPFVHDGVAIDGVTTSTAVIGRASATGAFAASIRTLACCSSLQRQRAGVGRPPRRGGRRDPLSATSGSEAWLDTSTRHKVELAEGTGCACHRFVFRPDEGFPVPPREHRSGRARARFWLGYRAS